MYQADQKTSQIVLDVIPPHYNLHHGQPSPPQSPNQFNNNNKGKFKRKSRRPFAVYSFHRPLDRCLDSSSASGSNYMLCSFFRLYKPRRLRCKAQLVDESLDERPKYSKISYSVHQGTTRQIRERILQRKLRIETSKVRTRSPTESAGKHHKGNFFLTVIKATISVYY